MDSNNSSRAQSHSVGESDPEMPVLQPREDSVVLVSDRPMSGHRKLPTPPPSGRLDKDAAVRRAVDMLRERAVARQYLAAGAGESDGGRSDLSAVAVQNLVALTTPILASADLATTAGLVRLTFILSGTVYKLAYCD